MSEEDAVPGEGEQGEGRHGVGIYAIGLGLAMALTIASFLAARGGLIWGPGIPAALIALAVAQMGVHLVFFLHITSGPENTNNGIALIFGTFVVVLVIGGSIWIMGHLDHTMIPMAKVMEMQR
jgi:cytochrome o ubiquinol oxidase operon protein cyoD